MILSRLLQKGCPGTTRRISPEFEDVPCGGLEYRPLPTTLAVGE
jgi:hypothetical protein